jgi:DNA-binding NarL/FixJ family response regulator/signal transduction histidine kinase
MGSVEPLIVNDVNVGAAIEFNDTPAVAVFKMRSYIGVPIVLSSGRVYGTLCALDRAPRQNDAHDIDYLLILARLLASQLDRRELGILEERNRLAREIHDTLAQSLTTLVLDLALHAGNVRRQAPALEADANTMLDTARDALSEVRRSIWNLQPGALDGRSLAQAIDAELRGLERAGIAGVLEVRGQVRDLASGVEAAALRIAQEGLANVRQHSQAGRVVATLEYGDDDLTLRVDDDGRGIASGSRRARTIEGGFGIASMRERVRLLGGDLSVTPRAGGGTALLCVIPYDASSAGHTTPSAATRGTPTPATTTQPPRTRVVIADDHTLVRQGLRRLLEETGQVEIVGEATDGEAALEIVAREQPDILLLDIQMPKLGGLGVLEQLHAAPGATPTRVLVMTTFAQDETVFQAVRLGARGYLLKDASAAELQAAIATVAAGGTLLTPAAAGLLAERLHRPDALTAREREVLGLVAEGLRNKEIAARLGASEKTVQFHIANLFGKLGAQSRTEAVRMARERGLLGV